MMQDFYDFHQVQIFQGVIEIQKIKIIGILDVLESHHLVPRVWYIAILIYDIRIKIFSAISSWYLDYLQIYCSLIENNFC